MTYFGRKFVAQKAGTRLDRLIADYSECGRRQSARLIDSRQVFVNGRLAKASYITAIGDLIEIQDEIQDVEALTPSPQTQALVPPKVIIETEDLFFFNKAPGWHTHSGLSSPSLADFLEAGRGPEQRLVGDRPEEAGIVHRLDRDTGGVVIVAKNRKFFRRLRSAFSAHRITKTYLALVNGRMQTNLSIDTALARRGARVVVAANGDKSLRACTQVEILEQGYDWSLVKALSSTGAPHQIRAHLSTCGHPLIGDVIYSGSGLSMARPGLGASGHLLHAFRVQVEWDTQGGEAIDNIVADVSAAPGDYFLTTLAALRRSDRGCLIS